MMSIGAAELLGIVILLALAAVPARIAQDKGRSFARWYLLGQVFFLPALLVARFMSDKSQNATGLTPQLLRAIEAHPGSTQEQLAVRTGVDTTRLLDPLLELRNKDLVQLRETGESFSIGRHSVPVVKAYPAP